MAKKTTKAVEAEAPGMLSLIETPDVPNPAPVDQARIVLLDAQKFDQFYDRIKGEADAHVPDVTTSAGRAAIKALSFRVTKTHTALKAASLELTDAWRKQTAAVNAARGPMIERLTNLAADVRRPLTEWEEVEAARIATNDAIIARISADSIVAEDDTSATVDARGRAIWAMTFPEPQWTPDEAVVAKHSKDLAVSALAAAKKRLVQEEADRAELEQLRRERAERAEREAAELAERERVAELERIERERLEREKAERESAEQAERDRIAEEERREREATERAERAAQEAADKARREAEQAAAEAQRKREEEAERQRAAERAEHERVLAAERAERERLEQVERDRVAAEQAEKERAEAERKRVAEENRKAAEAEQARMKDRAHRKRIQDEAVAALAEAGIDPEAARKVVTLIVAGEVPHCTVAF